MALLFAALLMLFSGAACGGHAVSTEPEPPARSDPGGASAGTGATLEMPSRGGSTSQPEPEPEPTCSGPEPVCVPDCRSLDRRSPQCDGQEYRCPSNWVDFDSCPADACARRVKSCCSPTGHTETPDCTEDGRIGACPDGFEPASVCVPRGLGIESCAELSDGQACASPESVCTTNRCGRNCYCNPDESGELKWQCWVNAC